MKKLQSPARNAVHAEKMAAKSMAAVLSVALMLGLTPAQALALAEDDAPTLEQAAPAEEQNGAAVETDTDASAILETSVSDESTDTAAADESEAPADVSDDGTDELASAEEFSRVQGSAASNFKLQSGSTTSIDQYSVSGEAIFSITEGGNYTIRGHRPLTQIKIDADKDEPVVLYLDDVSILADCQAECNISL